MFILVWLILSLLTWLIGFALFPSTRVHMARYSALSFLLTFGGLVAFFAASVAMGLVRIGEAYSLNVPEDYLARGTVGTALLIFGALAIVSPLLAAWLTPRQSPRPTA